MPVLPHRITTFFQALLWLIVLGIGAALLADIIHRITAPSAPAAVYLAQTDPRKAAQSLRAQSPMATQNTGAHSDQRTAAQINHTFSLVGVATGFGPYPGFALISNGSAPSVSYVLGDKIAPDVTLLELHPEHVIIEQSGIRQSLPVQKPTADNSAPADTQPMQQDVIPYGMLPEQIN